MGLINNETCCVLQISRQIMHCSLPSKIIACNFLYCYHCFNDGIIVLMIGEGKMINIKINMQYLNTVSNESYCI